MITKLKLNDNSKYMNVLTGISFTFLFFSMIYNFTYSAPWGDEWIEYNISQLKISDGSMYNSIIGTFQPPLYNFLMHFWLMLNNSITTFRLFNVVLGIFSSIALFKGLIKITNRFTANISLILLGTMYQYIYCIQECSEYALMLTFLFWAIYFFIISEENNTKMNQVLFVLMCVGAMYSQYGAFFIISPLLLINFIRCYKWKVNIKWLSAFYLFSFIIFAVPLYMLFARIQIANNQIANNSDIQITFELIKNIPLVFGDILSYFWGLNYRNDDITSCFRFLGIIILILDIHLIFRKKVLPVKKYLFTTLFISYFIYYFLVSFKIYAMVHPNESSGFTSRYGYFFMPFLSFVLPVMVNEIIDIAKSSLIKNGILIITMCITILIFFSSYPTILENWHKAYDDKYIEIWFANAGYNDITYLTGGAVETAFNYYASKTGCNVQNVFNLDNIDLGNMPDRFWLWRSNWGGEKFQIVLEEAQKQGYITEVYYNNGLARCIKSK